MPETIRLRVVAISTMAVVNRHHALGERVSIVAMPSKNRDNPWNPTVDARNDSIPRRRYIIEKPGYAVESRAQGPWLLMLAKTAAEMLGSARHPCAVVNQRHGALSVGPSWRCH